MRTAPGIHLAINRGEIVMRTYEAHDVRYWRQISRARAVGFALTAAGFVALLSAGGAPFHAN